MVQPPKDQDGSFFSKLHCKPQYKFPLIEKGKSENLEGQIPVLLSKSAGSCCQEPSDRDPLPHCQHKRERKDGRETFRNCTENAGFLLLSGVLSFGCLKRNWAEWGRDVFWSTWQIPYQVRVFSSWFFLPLSFFPYNLPLTESFFFFFRQYYVGLFRKLRYYLGGSGGGPWTSWVVTVRTPGAAPSRFTLGIQL